MALLCDKFLHSKTSLTLQKKNGGASVNKTKLNAGLALRQRDDLLQANISANKISLPQGQNFTERKYLLTSPKI